MPYLKGTATDYNDLLQQIVAWVTDQSVHGNDAWELMRNEPWPKGTILKAPGWQEDEHMYVGLMPKIIEYGKSYKQWFLTKEVLESEFVFNHKGANLSRDAYIEISGGNISVYVDGYELKHWRTHPADLTEEPKYHYFSRNSRSFYTSFSFLESECDIFSASSQAMFLSVSKQYSAGLPLHEQAGAPLLNVAPKPIKYYTYGASQPTNWTPPPYPGAGLPALGCNFEGFIDGYCTFWLVKDRHRLIIVTLDRDKWQTAQVGFLEPHHNPTEYAFPAVVTGNSGVEPVIGFWSYGGCLTPERGYKFNYSHSNQHLTNGNPTFASSYWDGSGAWNDDNAVSQVQLMLPDGTWKAFSNYAAWKQLIAVGCGGCPSYYTANGEPKQPAGMLYQIHPTYLDLTETRHIYQPDEAKYQMQLEPLELVQYDTNDQNARIGMLGTLWRMYWPSSPIPRFGEQTLGGKKHLVLPNGWEGRRSYLPHGITYETDPAKLMAQQQRIDAVSATMNCVIRLED